MSENGVYPQWNSHLVGIMISKTIGCRGTRHFQTNPYGSIWPVGLIHGRYLQQIGSSSSSPLKLWNIHHSLLCKWWCLSAIFIGRKIHSYLKIPEAIDWHWHYKSQLDNLYTSHLCSIPLCVWLHLNLLSILSSGWWFQPLWKIWVRQLGLFFPIYRKMFKPCSKPTTRFTRYYLGCNHLYIYVYIYVYIYICGYIWVIYQYFPMVFLWLYSNYITIVDDSIPIFLDPVATFAQKFRPVAAFTSKPRDVVACAGHDIVSTLR